MDRSLLEIYTKYNDIYYRNSGHKCIQLSCKSDMINYGEGQEIRDLYLLTNLNSCRCRTGLTFIISMSVPISSHGVLFNPGSRMSLSPLQVLGGQQRSAGGRGGGGEAAAEAGAHSPQLLPQHSGV